MDWISGVSLAVGVMAIVLAIVAIAITALIYDRTKDVLAEIGQKAAVIEKVVTGTQAKLVDTVAEIAKPQKETQEEILMKTLLPAMVEDPSLMERLAALGKAQDES